MKKFLSVLLAVMMVLSTVSFAAPSLAGVADSAVETPVVEVPVEETADLAAVITDNTDHGELVFELNFDNLANGTAVTNGQKLNTLGATLSSNIAKANDLYIVLSGYANAVVENGALKAVKTSTNRWPQIQVSVGTKNHVVSDGIIYMEADMKLDLTDAQTNTVTFGLTGYRDGTDGTEGGTSSQTSVQTVNAVDEQWQTLSGAYALNDEDGFTGLECVIFLPTYSGSSAEADYFYVDNLRLYYKPFNAKVTLTSDADYLTLPETFEVPTTGIAVSELVANVETAAVYQTVTGVKVNGTEYGLSDTVVITKDCEVEVLSEEDTEYTSEWIDKRYGILLFKSEFDSATVGSIDLLGDDNADLAAFQATSEMNPYFSEYSSMTSSMLLGAAGITAAEIVSDETLGSNVLKVTTSASYPSISYTTPYNQRSKVDLINSTTGVITINYKLTSGFDTTYRYYGWDTSFTQNAEDVEDAVTSTDLGNGYKEWVATYNMIDGYNIDAVKLHTKNPATGSAVCYDDIKIYWKPATVDLTIADCGIDGVKLTKTSFADFSTSANMKVSAFLTQAGFDYSEVSQFSYAFKGVSVSSNPSEVLGLDDTLYVMEDSTINLVFEEVDLSDWSDENGIVLFDIDFEDAKAATAFVPETNNKDFWLTSFNAKVNPYIAGTEKWALSSSGMDIVGIEDGALKIQWDGTGRWPQILIGNPTNAAGNELIGENGTYYIHIEYKALSPKDAELGAVNITANGFIDGAHQGSGGMLYIGAKNPTADEWFTIEGSKSTWDNDTDGLDNDDINKFTTVFNYSAATNALGGYFLIDNIKACWRPSKVDVTIEGGRNTGFETVTLEDVSTSATIDEIIAMLPGTVDDYGQLTGLADEDGNKLTSFSAVADVTLQALWTPWNVIEGAGQEFAINGEYYGGTKTQFAANSFGTTDTVGDGNTVTYAYITMYKGNGTNNNGYGVYTADNNLVYKQLTPTAGDSNVHGSNTYTDTYTVAAVPQGSNHRVSINLNLPANNTAKYILVKYKFQNVPDLTSDFAAGLGAVASADGKSATYTTRSGGTATYSNLVDYTAKYYVKTQASGYQYGGGKEFEAGKAAATEGDGVTVDIEALNDEWIYDLVPVNATMNTDGVAQILIDRPNHFRDMITVWDYVLVVSDGTEEAPIVPEQPEEPTEATAPATDTEKASIRTDSPSGLRFKASMSAATNEAASDYGWVVARKVTVENAGFELTDVTVDQEAFKVIVGYGRQNGADLKNFYEDGDETKIFTAVIYNLPAGMEEDILVARPFVKIDGEYLYGEPAAKSIYQVACAIRDGGYVGLTDYQKGKINAIIAAVEG